MGLKDFVKTIELVGAIIGGIGGILIVLMFWQAQKLGERQPEFSLGKGKILGFILILMFLTGILYTLLKNNIFR